MYFLQNVFRNIWKLWIDRFNWTWNKIQCASICWKIHVIQIHLQLNYLVWHSVNPVSKMLQSVNLNIIHALHQFGVILKKFTHCRNNGLQQMKITASNLQKIMLATGILSRKNNKRSNCFPWPAPEIIFEVMNTFEQMGSHNFFFLFYII